jgi:FkbM family methyltransferase
LLPEHRAARPEWPIWEFKRLESMHANIKEGDLVYYVGAEEGDMAALCALWGAKVVMFEPNDKVWPQIKAIWESNNLPRDMFYPYFASSVTTTDKLNPKYTDELPDGELIAGHGFKELKDTQDIPQVKLDDINVPPPDVICLDVEGSEGHVLRGARRLLIERHPKIYLSLHPEFMRDYKEWGAELRDWIINLGYKETLLDYPLHECHLLYEGIA